MTHPAMHLKSRTDSRISASEAEYMELSGAMKNAECHKVRVQGGVSTQLGCCDKYQPKSKDVQSFRCGECEYVRR